MTRSTKLHLKLSPALVGRSVELNIVLIHAEDHLTMAIMSIDFAEEFIELYKQNHK